MDSLLLFRNSPSSAASGIGFGVGIGGRSSSASSAERSLLLGALATHMGVLDARENDAQTIIRKSELWDEITRQFNVQASTPRSRQQIQTLYKNMKAKARRYEARLAEMSSGVPPPDPDPISEMLLGLLHQQLQHQRRHLQHHLASLDAHTHTHAHTLATNTSQEEIGKGGFRPFDASDVLTPEQVMQMSMEEGVAPELDVKDEPRDNDEDDETTHQNSASPELFCDPGLSDSRPVQGEDPSAQQADPEPNSHRQEEQTDDQRRSENQSQQQQQQQSYPLTTTPFGSSGSKLLYRQQVSALGNMPHLGAHTSPQMNSSPLLAQHSLPTEPQTLDFHQPPKRPKLDILPEVPRIGGSSLILPTKPPSATSSTSVCCSCPDLHASLLSLSRQEHHLREKCMQEERQMRNEEHTARMRIFALKEKVWRAKLKSLEDAGCCGDDEGDSGENEVSCGDGGHDDIGCDAAKSGGNGCEGKEYGRSYEEVGCNGEGDGRKALGGGNDENVGFVDEGARREDRVTGDGDDVDFGEDVRARNDDSFNRRNNEVAGGDSDACDEDNDVGGREGLL